MNILVTGGAGFIGSHLNDYLLKGGHKIVCIDDLSLGVRDNVAHNLNNENFEFVEMDILDKEKLNAIFEKGNFECVFHMAANSDIQEGTRNIEQDLDKTFMTTFRILEAMKKNEVKDLVFASSSAIYGDIKEKISEDIGPLKPVSLYGAAKLASEGYITAFGENFGIRSWIFRFPNVIGARATHGVVFDFVNKLKADPTKLVILGDGEQEKPYTYVTDIVEGILFGWENSKEQVNIFNLGVDSLSTVTRIAEIVVEEMGLENVKFEYTGGKSGWVGDVPFYQYDLSKIHDLGWQASLFSDEAVRKSAQVIFGNK
ncbi:NAD-dependent epimerase/dehydratase family protein [Candidatus Peregrinibacteria bacterium]|jgi:UDP-glucose 4-epimerase|nr:NAD-dependent epimerase/dehydratase family protein [Candidatus Peregrinibacteria bacterium]